MFESVGRVFELAAAGDTRSVFLLGAIYVVLVCAWSAAYQLRVRRWPTVTGKLLWAGVRRFGAGDLITSEQDHVADALYEYVVDGETFRGQRVSTWIVVASHNLRGLLRRQLRDIDVSPDGTVAVHHHPRNPAKSVLIKPGAVSLLGTLFIGVAPLVLYGVKYGA